MPYVERRHEADPNDADDFETRLVKQGYYMKIGDLPALPNDIDEAMKNEPIAYALELADRRKTSLPPAEWNALIASMATNAGEYGQIYDLRACIAHAPILEVSAPWLGLLAVAAIEADDEAALLASILDAGVPATWIDLNLEIDLFNHALGENHPAQMELLLDRGANVNSWQAGHHQLCGIEVAVDFCRDVEDAGESEDVEDDGTAALRLMLERGADIEGSGALKKASREGIMVAVRLLVEAGSPLEEVDGSFENRGSALYRAARHGRTKVVEYLVSKGANLHAQGQFTKKTPLEVAREGGHTETAAVLQKALGSAHG